MKNNEEIHGDTKFFWWRDSWRNKVTIFYVGHRLTQPWKWIGKCFNTYTEIWTMSQKRHSIYKLIKDGNFYSGSPFMSLSAKFDNGLDDQTSKPNVKRIKFPFVGATKQQIQNLLGIWNTPKYANISSLIFPDHIFVQWKTNKTGSIDVDRKCYSLIICYYTRVNWQ